MKRYLGIALGLSACVAAPLFAQELKYSPGLWESKVRIERYAKPGNKPTSVDTKTERICIVPGDEKTMQPLFSADLADSLKGKCWQSDSREEPGRRQVKMACENGTTAESVARLEADGSIGSMIVLNDPKQGGLKLQGVSRKVAATCPPEAAKPQPVPPTPPAPPSTAKKP